MKIVDVRWVDSWQVAAGWNTRKWLRKRADDLPRLRTVGLLVSESKRVLVVASSVNASGDVAAVVAIPKRCVVRVRRLR